MSPESLAAMLTDTELETRAAELADDLRQCDEVLRHRGEWHQDWNTDRAHFRALWRALRVIRAEQEGLGVECIDSAAGVYRLTAGEMDRLIGG